MNLNFFFQSIEPKLIKWRRDFHKFPELGFMEYRTTLNISKELKSLNFDVFTGKDVMSNEGRLGLPNENELIQAENKLTKWQRNQLHSNGISNGFTGVVGKIDTQIPGPHYAFRFDIDALPITESNNINHLPNIERFASVHEGVMHACGHDGHMAIGLGLATFISSYLNKLVGSFTLIFQPAEEGGRGAKAIVDKGWLDTVDLFFSGHIGLNNSKVGTVSTAVNGLLASTKIDANFIGESSHAGLNPEVGRNSLLAASSAVTNIYAIPRHSNGISRVNVGKIKGGEGRNIISSSCSLEIETRGATQVINEYMSNNVFNILKGAAKMHNVDVNIDIVGMTPVINCNKNLITDLIKIIKTNENITELIPITSISVSEDAGHMINKVHEQGGKGTYMLFGTRLPFNHHHPQFDFEENALIVALDAYIQILLN